MINVNEYLFFDFYELKESECFKFVFYEYYEGEYFIVYYFNDLGNGMIFIFIEILIKDYL